MLTLIRLPICNVYLLRGRRPILVDTGRPRDARRITAALARHGVALRDLALILHTHGHWDHCGSTRALREQTWASIAVHRADAPLVRRGDNGALRGTSWAGRLFRGVMDFSFPPLEPNLLIDGALDLSAFGVRAEAIPTPGHTDGSISVLTADGDAIVGDLLMGGFLGGRLLPGRPGYHYFAADLDAVHASVRKVLELRPRRIYTGHGGPLAPEDVARWLARVGAPVPRRAAFSSCPKAQEMNPVPHAAEARW